MFEQKKCIIYSRVSTKKQKAENQTAKLIEYAKSKNYKIVDIIEEVQSTRKARVKLKKILNRNNYNLLLIYSLDRISRNGLFETIKILTFLSDRGISIESYNEPILNTTDSFTRDIIIAVLSAIANSEREKISERTKLGLERARNKGKILGRPERTISEERKEKIKELLSLGYGYGKIGKSVNLKKSAVQYFIKKYNLKKYKKPYGIKKGGVKNP